MPLHFMDEVRAGLEADVKKGVLERVPMGETDKYITAIKNFPTPANISTVCSWFGLINQVPCSFMKMDHMAPFCHLLSQLLSSGMRAWKQPSRGVRRRSWS